MGAGEVERGSGMARDGRVVEIALQICIGMHGKFPKKQKKNSVIQSRRACVASIAGKLACNCKGTLIRYKYGTEDHRLILRPGHIEGSGSINWFPCELNTCGRVVVQVEEAEQSDGVTGRSRVSTALARNAISEAPPR